MNERQKKQVIHPRMLTSEVTVTANAGEYLKRVAHDINPVAVRQRGYISILPQILILHRILTKS